MASDAFAVIENNVRLSVETDGDVVTTITLNGRAARGPQRPFESHVAAELREYLAGRRKRFTFPYQPQGTAFQHAVWQALEGIPFGETRTYGEVARAIGKPHAARAVGQANHHNPIPIVIPCHRVVAAGGKLGGYGGGLPLKKRLLSIEAAAL